MLYIVIDEVYDEALSGSSSPATKMSASIMTEILPYLGIYPDGDIEYQVDLSLLIGNGDNAEGDESNPDVLPEGLEGGLDEEN
jgi:stage V sporulation protein D (sporulation-specific penicillin-binding protein)